MSALAITGTALIGAQGIVGAATGGGKSKEASKEASKSKKGEAIAAIGSLLQQITRGGAGLEGSLRQLSELGRANPEALRSALAANPQATQSLSAATGG